MVCSPLMAGPGWQAVTLRAFTVRADSNPVGSTCVSQTLSAHVPCNPGSEFDMHVPCCGWQC